jgi:site-specific recombinase XerC
VASAAGLTVAVLLEEYLHHLAEDKGRKHSTLVRYRGLARKWVVPAIGTARVSRILPQDVETLLGRMRREGQSQSSIHQVFTLLNGAFKWGKRNRRVASNPLVEVEEPRSAVPALRWSHRISEAFYSYSRPPSRRSTSSGWPFTSERRRACVEANSPA